MESVPQNYNLELAKLNYYADWVLFGTKSSPRKPKPQHTVSTYEGMCEAAAEFYWKNTLAKQIRDRIAWRVSSMLIEWQKQNSPPDDTLTPSQAYAKCIAELCIDEANLSIDTSDTDIPIEDRHQEARNHIEPMIETMSTDIEREVDALIAEMIPE